MAVKVKAEPKLKMVIKGLPISTAVQSTAISPDGTYVIVNQLKDKVDQYISKCKITGEGVAKYESHMVLKNCGHSETNDIYEYNGKTYLLVAIKPTTLKNQVKQWATQIGRIEYEAGKTINGNSNISRISNICNRRIEVALSSDKTKIAIYKITQAGKRFVMFYNFTEMNRSMDKRKGGYTPLSYFDQIQKTITLTAKVIPYGSVQGIEYSDGGRLMIIGGDGAECKEFKINIFKKGSSEVYKEIIITHKDFEKGVEPEGVRINGKEFNITISNKKDNSKRVAIYSLDKAIAA